MKKGQLRLATSALPGKRNFIALLCFTILSVTLCGGTAIAQAQGWQPVRRRSWVPRWIPSVSRSSLLPHRFAGICMNCHAILGGTPRPIDRRSLERATGLSASERALVQAGQQVRTPTIISDIKAPLIGRNAVLPHKFWGVCSNCHSILHAGTGPSPTQIRLGMGRAQEGLLAMQLSDEQISYATPNIEINARGYASYFFGVCAFLFFLATMIYPAMEVAAARNAKKYAGTFDLRKWSNIHQCAALGFTGCALLHWFFSPRGNAILHFGLLLAIATAISGVAYKAESIKTRRPLVGWLHTQRYLTYLMIGVVLAGHLAVSSIWLE